MAIIFSLSEAPTGADLSPTIIEDITDVIGVDGYCQGDGSNITDLPGGFQYVSGCTSGEYHGLELIVGAKYQLKVIGDAPVVMTVYDEGGTLPHKFTFAPNWNLGNPAFPAWSPSWDMYFGPDCTDLPVGATCSSFYGPWVGVGTGTFHSLVLQQIVSEPAPITLLAIAILVAVAHKHWARRRIRRRLGEFAT
jgi:hypothetical protein